MTVTRRSLTLAYARDCRPLGVLLLVVLLGSGCTQYGPYRTRTLIAAGPGSPATYDRVACFAGTASGSLPSCEGQSSPPPGAYAIQERHYVYRDRPGTPAQQRGQYHLAFVEFDDQGWFADRKQMEALFMLLDRLERDASARPGRGGHPLIFLYAHGWKHNASACDNNVVCFSRLLERMDILEQHRNEALPPGATSAPPRPVVGVYVGWRGLSLDAGALSNVTFWSRKATAERVGRGGVKELLTRLENYRRARNRGHDDDKTQLIVAGHSFGGAVIYSALSHALMEQASITNRFDAPDCRQIHRRKTRPDGVLCYDTATSFGDVVVLVNPAFEGTAYEPLFHVATNRCYPPWQRPVMLTVTSEGDDATGIAFPLGRKVSTLFEHRGSPAQGDSIVKTVGHAARYETHRLKWKGETPPEQREQKHQSCSCPYLDSTEDFDWRGFVTRVKGEAARSKQEGAQRALTTSTQGVLVPTLRDGKLVYDVYGREVALVTDEKYALNYPYLVIKADREIIPDHNSIYNESFVKFLHAFFLLHIADDNTFPPDGCSAMAPETCPAGSLVPCEQSCQQEGASCSGRSTDLTPASPSP